MTDYLHALPPGYRIDEYELVRVLGSGGFGITYLGYDHHLDKAVAIKEYLPNDLAVRTDNNSVLPKSTQDKTDYEWGLARFLNEAQTLARFDHRHIIKIHRFFRAHGTGYSVMEYAEGETLSEVLQRKGTLTESELKAILFPILDGLEAVHEADFLHRDIKPGNIVIRDDGSPVLIDFGSARQAVAGKSRSVTAIVTPGYAPIEQYSAKGHQGPWTDIYGLGAVCYRCLTGEPPDDATERLRADPLVPAAQRCKGKVSAAFLNAIDRALRVDEGERPQDAAEWRDALLGRRTVSSASIVSSKPVDLASDIRSGVSATFDRFRLFAIFGWKYLQHFVGNLGKTLKDAIKYFWWEILLPMLLVTSPLVVFLLFIFLLQYLAKDTVTGTPTGGQTETSVTSVEIKEESALESALMQAVNEINQHLPTMVNANTRLDSVAATISGNKQFRYKYTLTNFPASKVDIETLTEAEEPRLINSVCTTREMKVFIENGVRVTYAYYGKNGKLITTITVYPYQCKSN